MAKFRSIRNSFIAGQISPTAMGRTDLPQYNHACKTLKNMVPILSGGAYRRPGTFLEGALLFSDNLAPRVIPFVYSKDEAYSLLFKKARSGSTSGNGTITAYRPLTNVQTSSSFSVTGTHPYRVALDTLSNGYKDEIFEVQYTQSADILYLTHPNHKPQRVSRTAANTFAIAAFDNGLTGTTFRDAWPYLKRNTTATTLAVSNAAIGTGRTLTASAALFNSLHVGAVFKITDGATVGCVLVTAYTDSTHVTVSVIQTCHGTTAQSTWWESAWSDYRGWPGSVAFFQQRLGYGGTTHQPDTIYFTETADYNQLSHDTIIDPNSEPTGQQAFAITISSQQLNSIQWMSAERTLFVGTTGDEITIDKESGADFFGADGASVQIQTHHGSSKHLPVRIGSELVFALKSDDELKTLIFDDIEKSYVDEPIQLLFDEHPKIDNTYGNRQYREFAWDGSRKTLWCCDTTGNLFGMTRDRRIQATAWHTHEMGGYDADQMGSQLTIDSGGTQDSVYENVAGTVVSLAVVPNPIIGMNDIWFVVKRYINGAFQWHVERMIGGRPTVDSAYDQIISGVGQYLSDASVIYSAVFNPLLPNYQFVVPFSEGETVIGNAFTLDKGIFIIHGGAVSSGLTTLQTPYPSDVDEDSTIFVFGLDFNSIVEPVRIEAGSQIGTSQGALKRIHELELRFYKTMSAKVGSDADHLETIIFREASTPMNKSAELFTGDKRVKFSSDYDRDGYIYLIQDQPLPFAIISLVAEGQTYD